MNRQIIIFIIVLFLASCTKTNDSNSKISQKKSTVEKGMSYDEVREIMGAPSDVVKGIRKYCGASSVDIAFLKGEPMQNAPIQLDFTHCDYDLIIEGTSQYVTWAYDSLSFIRKFIYEKDSLASREYYSVIFDVASGRVSDIRYCPFTNYIKQSLMRF